MKDPLFANHLLKRYEASRSLPPDDQTKLASEVMSRSGFPWPPGRRGISGAANAYLLLIASEFGAKSPGGGPFSPGEISPERFDDLWRLRVGERNPHFASDLTVFRENRALWSHLYSYLPKVFGDAEVAYGSFAWANLSDTPGGDEKGTSATHREGMHDYIAPFIRHCQPRVVASTNKPSVRELDRWIEENGGEAMRYAGGRAWRVETNTCVVIAGHLGGHPSHWNQYMSSTEFVHRLKTLIDEAEKTS